jgi:ferredoxin/flavodoxin---NADP+ reductase
MKDDKKDDRKDDTSADDAPGPQLAGATGAASGGRTLHDIFDLTIIGAGPTGLFAKFYAGMRGATARIVDALPQVGGQLTALYPEKYIFDVAGFPKVLAKDLVRSLSDQAGQFGTATFLSQRVAALEEDGGVFTVVTETDRFPSRAVLVAAGIGAFSPRRLPQAVADQWYGRGIHDVVTDPEAFRGQRVVIIGGGDSAFDWAHQLSDRAEFVTLVHRTDRFRAHAATVRAVESAAASGRAEILTFHELHDVLGAGSAGENAAGQNVERRGDSTHARGGVPGEANGTRGTDGFGGAERVERLRGVVLRDTKRKSTREVKADAVLPMLGFVSDMGPLAEWGLTMVNDEILVTQTMETGRPGLYAAGDITTYPGKLKLIATGFGEAAIAVNQAVHWIYPAKKVAPGHSSNMALFGQSEDS